MDELKTTELIYLLKLMQQKIYLSDDEIDLLAKISDMIHLRTSGNDEIDTI